MKFFMRYAQRFQFAFAGLCYALCHDVSFRWQVLLLGVVLGGLGYVAWPLSQVEMYALIFAYALVLITELQNSALEEALDHLHPDEHHRIGRAKDMAAGSVLLAGFVTLVVVALVFTL